MTPHVGHGHTSAKIILFGEHSVVYGYPAIAMPLHSLRMTAHAERGDDGASQVTTAPARVDDGASQSTLTSLGWSGPMQEALLISLASCGRWMLRWSLWDILALRFISPRHRISRQQRGLGSSAAAAGAVIRAILVTLTAFRPLLNSSSTSLKRPSALLTGGHPDSMPLPPRRTPPSTSRPE